MKKLFLSLGLVLGTMFSTNATTLVIDNQCHTYVCIQLIQTSTLNGISYEYYNGLCGFSVNGGDVFQITDGDFTNYQFPFLNVWPFAGNVLEETATGSTVMTTSLPYTSDDNIPTTERYQLQQIKFQLKGANGTGYGPPYDPFTGQVTMDQFYPTFIGTYYYLPGMPQYEVSFIRMWGIYYFTFEDL